MLDYAMSTKEYREMISQPAFEMKQYEWVGYDEFEQLVSFGKLANLFEELADKYGRVPTQTEYVNEGLAISKAFFVGKSKPNGDRWLPIQKDKQGKVLKWHNFKWEDRLEQAIKQRLARSYPSHMVEYSTILQLKEKYPEFKVGANDYLDGIMAVDIVVGSEKHNKVLYVHVTSASDYSNHWLKKKEDRKGVGFSKDGSKHYYTRNFKKGHVHLAFSRTEETASTEFVNGIPIFKDSHIQSVIEMAFLLAPHMDSWEKQEQLMQLHNWLKDNHIDDAGLGAVWL
jgi:hypothetical protein